MDRPSIERDRRIIGWVHPAPPCIRLPDEATASLPQSDVEVKPGAPGNTAAATLAVGQGPDVPPKHDLADGSPASVLASSAESVGRNRGRAGARRSFPAAFCRSWRSPNGCCFRHRAGARGPAAPMLTALSFQPGFSVLCATRHRTREPYLRRPIHRFCGRAQFCGYEINWRKRGQMVLQQANRSQSVRGRTIRPIEGHPLERDTLCSRPGRRRRLRRSRSIVSTRRTAFEIRVHRSGR